MFALGSIGFLHELLSQGAERPFILALSGGLMGLPFVLSADQKLQSPFQPKPPVDDVDDERWSHLP